MDEENISLTNPRSSVQRGSRTLYLWWGLNILLVVFVFLAFLFSTLTYTHSKHLAKEVNNSFITQQGGLIQQTYKVTSNFSVTKGQAVSFCATNQICSGLGPEWGESFFGTGSATPAIMASFAQLSASATVYAHVVDSDHTVIRFTAIDSSATPGVKTTATLATSDTVTKLIAMSSSNPNIAVVFYSSHNVSYLVAVQVSTDLRTVTLADPVEIFQIDVNNAALRSDAIRAGDWTLVTYGHDHEGCKYLAYAIDGNSNTKLRKVELNAGQFSVQALQTISTAYLGGAHGGWFIQANANSARLGWIDTGNLRIDSLASTALGGYYFDQITITPSYNNQIVLSGIQTEYVDAPLLLTMIIEWFDHTPYLIVNAPVNMLGVQNHMALRDQISVCYLPPYDQEPQGGLFFSYVDQDSLRAKLMRARVAVVNGQMQLLPSASVDISTIQYGKHGSWFAPILSCPTAANHVLVAVQDFYSIFNTFTWKGGFRFAGIVQASAGEGKDVNVVRQGISTGHTGLIPGYHYYMYNNGTLAPYTSLVELFTPNGFSFRIGTALTDTSLFLEDDIFDRFY